MIAEGNETPQTPRGDPPAGGAGGTEGRGWRGEGDLLAERRARRAAEAPEHLLTLRAEAAEATVRTLESHLATVQQRLRDAEAETRRLQEALVAEAGEHERAAGGGGGDGGETSGRSGLLERELQRAHQREQAEHRARVEAEDRAQAIERDDRAEIDRLARRLDANERYVRALAAQLQDVERRLLDAEERVRAAESRAAAAEERARGAETRAGAADEHARAAEAGASAEVRARVAALESSAAEVGRGLERERAERERAERVLTTMRRGQRRVEGVVRELGTIVSRLRAQATHVPPPRVVGTAPRTLPGASELAARRAGGDGPRVVRLQDARGPDRGAELENALEAAVARLRARAEEAGPAQREDAAERAAELQQRTRAGAAIAGAKAQAAAPAPPARAGERTDGGVAAQPGVVAVKRIEGAAQRGDGGIGPAAQAWSHAPADDAAAAQGSPAARVSHKHSLSLIGRIRRARKQRREHR